MIELLFKKIGKMAGINIEKLNTNWVKYSYSIDKENLSVNLIISGLAWDFKTQKALENIFIVKKYFNELTITIPIPSIKLLAPPIIISFDGKSWSETQYKHDGDAPDIKYYYHVTDSNTEKHKLYAGTITKLGYDRLLINKNEVSKLFEDYFFEKQCVNEETYAKIYQGGRRVVYNKDFEKKLIKLFVQNET
jgi:hypothetical protein